jgi:hypothetical protein
MRAAALELGFSLGAEVVAHEVRLEAGRWRSPVPVEVEGMEAARPLLGA